MVAFVNSFLSYLLVVIFFAVVIVCGVLVGKKLRESKDAKEAVKAAQTNDSNEENK